MIIKCNNWKKIEGFENNTNNNYFKGQCVVGKYKGFPTFGHCIDLCGQCDNKRSEMDEYIKTLAEKEQSPEQRAEHECKQKEREAHEQKLLAELPKGLKLVGNLKRHLKEIHDHYKATGRLKVTNEQRAERLAICDNCPSGKMVIKDGVRRCALSSCGCYLDNPNGRPILDGKADYEALTCDNGHWPKL